MDRSDLQKLTLISENMLAAGMVGMGEPGGQSSGQAPAEEEESGNFWINADEAYKNLNKVVNEYFDDELADMRRRTKSTHQYIMRLKHAFETGGFDPIHIQLAETLARTNGDGSDLIDAIAEVLHEYGEYFYESIPGLVSYLSYSELGDVFIYTEKGGQRHTKKVDVSDIVSYLGGGTI